jgi:hypothetical protein
MPVQSSRVTIQDINGSSFRWGTELALPTTFFACFLTFAHRFFAALTIAPLPAADRTRLFAPTTSRSAEWPNGLQPLVLNLLGAEAGLTVFRAFSLRA